VVLGYVVSEHRLDHFLVSILKESNPDNIDYLAHRLHAFRGKTDGSTLSSDIGSLSAIQNIMLS